MELFIEVTVEGEDMPEHRLYHARIRPLAFEQVGVTLDLALQNLMVMIQQICPGTTAEYLDLRGNPDNDGVAGKIGPFTSGEIAELRRHRT